MENKETVFRAGDKVFDYLYQWGVVKNNEGWGLYPVTVDFSGNVKSYTEIGAVHQTKPQSLSFTKYDYMNGGFSQERPELTLNYIDTLYLSSSDGGRRGMIMGKPDSKNMIYLRVDENEDRTKTYLDESSIRKLIVSLKEALGDDY